MRSEIQQMMPFCVTTSLLCLVTFSSEMKQSPLWGSHEQAGLAKGAPGLKGLCLRLGCSQDGRIHALGHQNQVSQGWKQAAGAASFCGRDGLGQTQISIYTILELT